MDKKLYKKQIIKNILAGICFFGTVLFPLATRWGFSTWVGLTMDELVYHLTSPIDGTGGGIIESLFATVIIPSAAIGILVFGLLTVLIRKKDRAGAFAPEDDAKAVTAKIGKIHIARKLMYFSILVSFVICLVIFVKKVKLIEYLQGQVDTSTFVQEQYVDPKDATLTFPEEKRNLVYIYLESMETSYADKASGGAMEVNYIPELTNLALNNECFAGNSGILNGGIPLPGATWTMGAIMADTSGLPLQVTIKHNGMSSQESFFPSMETLGDILEEQGYNQTFMIGSKATFGGRDVYFRDHGNYDIKDYYWAIDQGLIDPDYFVFWGYEDEKLFTYAREELTRLAEESKTNGTPFNFTLLTVDTHFEDGYLCELCGDQFDDQYANVIACSSKQVSELVAWIQEQDWYDNTTVILTGDHLTMDTDFCGSVPEDYTRKTYTAFIHSAAETEDPEAVREYSTFDLFPTTLAAMGVDIEGEKLGLGTNLFASSVPTLLETYGYDYLAEELNRRSLFVEELSGVDYEAAEEANQTEEKIRMQVDLEDYDVDSKTGTLVISDCHGLTETTRNFEVHLYPDKASDDYVTYVLNFDSERGGYASEISLDGYDFSAGKIATYQISTSGKSWKTCTISGSLLMEQKLYEFMADDTGETLTIEASGKWWKYFPPKAKELLAEMGVTIPWSTLKSNQQSFCLVLSHRDGMVISQEEIKSGEPAPSEEADAEETALPDYSESFDVGYQVFDDIYYFDHTGMLMILEDADGEAVEETLIRTNKLPMTFKQIDPNAVEEEETETE